MRARPATPTGGLPRGERLRARADFERLFRRGARIERPAFVLLWVPEGGPRAVGFAAGRRLGGSVARNRARRRLREAYRCGRAALPASGVRLCLIARRAALTVPFEDLCAQVQAAFRGIARTQGNRTG